MKEGFSAMELISEPGDGTPALRANRPSGVLGSVPRPVLPLLGTRRTDPYTAGNMPVRGFTLLLILSLWRPAAWAEVTLRELVIRRTGTEVNIRVNLLNEGGRTSAQRPVLSLFIRPDARAPWEPFKVWFLGPIKPGQRISRDFFFAGNPRLTKIALENPRFEIKARLTLGQSDKEKTAVSGDSDGPMTGASPATP